jgi:hypothetical protein
MGILFLPPFVLPRLADGGGKRRGNCLRAKPEFFRVPPSSRSKGSPQGQDWLGCHFLVSSFGHAKEERENSRKAIATFPNELFLCGFRCKPGQQILHTITGEALRGHIIKSKR